MPYPAGNKTSRAGRSTVYLLAGQDIAAKEAQLNKIKQEWLPAHLRDFSLDTLYGSEVSLKELQQRIKSLPLENTKRMVVIKDAQRLNSQAKAFLSALVKRPPVELILVLDFQQYDQKDEFIRELSLKSTVLRFKETAEPDAFLLNRQIELKKPDAALRVLSQLLENGEPAERILGGLRYAWEKQDSHSAASRRKLKLLLHCDLEIKTGRLKPAYALEKLVISLCAFV